jgi:hypothetical protein
MPQSIEAELTYIIDDGQPSIRYVDWPEEAHKAHVASYENRPTHIYNARLSDELFDLNRHGFLLVTEPTKVRNFYDEGEIKRIYYPETAELIKRNSGGKRVYVFDHTIRTPVQEKHKEGWVRNPVRYVHNDYTELSAPQRVKDFFPNEYDTDPNVGVKFTAHTAFEGPTGIANAPARQSIEVRALVFFN